MDEAAHRAIKAKVRKPIGTRVASWYDKNDMRKVAAAAFAFACLVGVTLYEMTNAALGGVLFAKGVVPPFFAFLMGAGLVVGYIGFHRSASEKYRAKQWYTAGRATIAAVLFAVVSLFLVFSNTASKTGMTAKDAVESNSLRAELILERKELYPRTTDNHKAQLEALALVTQRQIESFEAEAVGWQLGTPAPPGSDEPAQIATPAQCAKNLQPRPRILCNELNGSADSMGKRNEIILHEAALAQFERDRLRLNEINGILKDLPRVEGQAHWQSMQDVTFGAFTADFFRIFGAALISLVLLIGAGFGWDIFFEAKEAEEAEAEGKVVT